MFSSIDKDLIGADDEIADGAANQHLSRPGEAADADAEALPFPDASLDAVVANFLVLHLGRPERAAGSSHAY